MFRFSPVSSRLLVWPPAAPIMCLIVLSVPGSVHGAASPGTYTDLHDFGGTVVNANALSGADGTDPACAPIFDSAGNMYGTAVSGGPNFELIGGNEDPGGTLWKFTASGNYIDLHDFGGYTINADGTNGPDGAGPPSNITFDSAGNMYGTTQVGGPNFVGGDGTIWEITSAGVYKDLHDFGGQTINSNGAAGPDGGAPGCAVTLDSAGDMYGTAAFGGLNGFGMLWELTPAGVYKDLHDFGGTITNASGVTGGDGIFPRAGIIFDSSWNMYGTTSNGLASKGIIWEITSSGVYKDLHDFGGTVTNADGAQGPDGSQTFSGVTFDSSRNMYGTSGSGGANGEGIVWKLSSSGVYTDLHDFGGTITNSQGVSGSDGDSPDGNVAFDSAGNIYGTAIYNDLVPFSQGGMLWEINTAGTYIDLHDFDGTITDAEGVLSPDGSVPEAAVTFDSSGAMYGTTFRGGPNGGGHNGNWGILWKITGVGSPAAPTGLTASGGSGQIALSWTTVTGATSYNVYRGTIAGQESGTPIATSLNANSFTDTGLASTTTYFYTVKAVNGGIISGASNEANATTLATISGFSFATPIVVGGNSVTATITLPSAAPVGGLPVALSVPLGSAQYVSFPATVTVPAGQSTYTFSSIQTHTVVSATTVVLSATVGSKSIPATLSISFVSGGTQAAGLQFFSEPWAYSDTLANIFASPLSSGTIANWNASSLSYLYQGGTVASPTSVTISLGVGYWAIFPSGGDSLLYLGTPASTTTPTTISLVAGWNPIGDPYTSSVRISSLTFGATNQSFASSAAVISPTLYYFQQGLSSTSGSYVAATSTDSLIPGKGYWIYAFSTTTLTFPLPGGGIIIPPPPVPVVSAPPVTTTGTGTTTTIKKRKHH